MAKRDINGVLLLDKPAGLTSNDALQLVRRLFQARKGGHGGTLDPLASGLLPIAFGQGTKFINDLVQADKTYLADIRLGFVSSTGDGEGTISTHDPDQIVAQLQESEINSALQQLTGEIEQVPPMYSAVKHRGKPLYSYARKGQQIERAARRVRIHKLSLTHFDVGRPQEIQVRVVCSKGTYIRVLAEDIGHRLGCGAYLSALRRQAVGQFDLDDAVTLDQLKLDFGNTDRLLEYVKPIDTMLAGLPLCQIPATRAQQFRHGQPIALADVSFAGDWPADGSETGAARCRVYASDQFLGLAAVSNEMLTPRRVVVSTSGSNAGPA